MDLQRKSVEVLAGVHAIDITDGRADLLEPDPDLDVAPPLAQEQAYYEWTCEGAGRRFPTIERAFDWIERNWPTNEGAAAISWYSRIGNIMWALDGTDPVAVLDWEMATIVFPGLGWLMCFIHQFFETILGKYEVPTLPSCAARGCPSPVPRCERDRRRRSPLRSGLLSAASRDDHEQDSCSQRAFRHPRLARRSRRGILVQGSPRRTHRLTNDRSAASRGGHATVNGDHDTGDC